MQRVLVPLSIVPSRPSPGCPLRHYAGQSMGTSWSVHVVETVGACDWQVMIQQQLNLVDVQMSHWKADSHLERYNRAAAGSWHELPEAFAEVMTCAVAIAALSEGAYDPGAGSLVNLWGFGPHGRHADPAFNIPDSASVGRALADCGWQRLQFSKAGQIFQPGGLQLDLSAIAKGYVVDRIARQLHSVGVDHFLIEVGGELRGGGMKPDGQPWWVGLEEPEAGPQPATLLALHGLSIATSGDYRRNFVRNGRRYAHTLDPRRGFPVTHALASVTVLHPECMHADAWSTALTVMGVEAGLACAETHGLAVRFLERSTDGFREYLSSQFRAMLQ